MSDGEELVISASMEAFVVYSTDDLTEGRTMNYPWLVTRCEATARRLGKGQYIQGCDCPIEVVPLFQVGDHWYGPVRVINPTKEDTQKEAQLKKYHAAVDKAERAGLTKDEIRLLVGGAP